MLTISLKLVLKDSYISAPRRRPLAIISTKKYKYQQVNLSQGRRTFGTRPQNITTASTAVPEHLHHIANNMCVYIDISDCVDSVYELPLLPNNTAVKHFYTNRVRWEVLTGYLLWCWPGGDWANTLHWEGRFSVFF